MPELLTDRNEEEGLCAMVWAIVATHQRQRPELYSAMHLEKRIQELAIVIGEVIACAGHGIQRHESEADEYVSNLLAIATGQVSQAVFLHLRRLRTGAALPDHLGVRKPS